MRKTIGVTATVLCAALLTGCSFLGEQDRTNSNHNRGAADQAVQASVAGIPYILGAGSPDGATDPLGTGQTGFDEVGLIAWAYGSCCNMYVGDSVESIYEVTVAPEWSEEEDNTPLVGDLVFSEDKTSVGIITQSNPDRNVDLDNDGVMDAEGDFAMVTASREAGEVVEIPWDKERFPTIREVHNPMNNELRVRYSDWSDRYNDRYNVDPGSIDDPNDPNRERIDELVVPN